MHVRTWSRVTDGSDPRAADHRLSAHDPHVAEVLVGRDQRPAAHAHGSATPRHAPGEAHTTGARGVHERTGRRREVDAAMLPCGEAVGTDRKRTQEWALDRANPCSGARAGG